MFFFWLKKKNIPLPEMEPTAPAVEVQSVNPWTAKEVPGEVYLEGGSWPSYNQGLDNSERS